MFPRLHSVTSCKAEWRHQAIVRELTSLAPGTPALIVGATRSAADELAFQLATRLGGAFGVSRVGFLELITRLAIPSLAPSGLSPTGGLGAEALAARATFGAMQSGQLAYFHPVSHLPGFPRALAGTLDEVRMAGVDLEALATLDLAGRDLAVLLDRADEEARQAGTADRARLVMGAIDTLDGGATFVHGAQVVLLDVALATTLELQLVAALGRACDRMLATVPGGDERTLAALHSLGFTSADAPPPDGDREVGSPAALDRLQSRVFSRTPEPESELDGSVTMFSAPGEGREAVEIARRVLAEAGRGVPFDQMAVLLRAPSTYVSLVEHAFERAGVPCWFDRGTRRPDASGRAFLALLACADEDLSARRFAEYLSLGQVPTAGAAATDPWPPPADEMADAIVPASEAPADEDPQVAAQAASNEPEQEGIAAGTLRAPWRWEELLVESAVIGRLDRWERRLGGLSEEYRLKLSRLETEEPESPRIPAIRRDLGELGHLERFALPLVEDLAAWPRGSAWRWGEWIAALEALTPRVLKHPTRVLRVLHELGPLAEVGPVSLREVRDVLTPRLLTLTQHPPRRRHGAVFVGTPSAARGRSFRVVFVPGLAERVFPQRLREDALLLDDRRERLGSSLLRQKDRADRERLQLRLAIGAASERVYLSWPRVELQESRPRVPSFYVLDAALAVEGRIPDYGALRDRAFRAGGASLAWPAPERPVDAIDVFEHDLAMLHQLLRTRDHAKARGRGRYLYELSPHLQRSLTWRWARWQPKWHQADGLIRVTAATAPALARQRLGARPFSLSALQRFAACPYQFVLSAVFRLAPREEPTPLQRLDPLTRGSLFHAIQAEFLRSLEKNSLLPLTDRRLEAARKLLEWSIGVIARKAYDDLAPAIDRVWHDELASMARDLRGWLEGLAEDGREWCPERFELAFGLPGDLARDPRSLPEPARVDGRFLIRGSIDLVERRLNGRTLRVTDHKTGKNRTNLSTMVDGGRVLQPILYGMALEALSGETVEEGRLSYCTYAGQFARHRIPLDEVSRRRALEVLEVIDRAVEHGTLAANPAEGSCRWCDFLAVCGSDEERRTRRKPVVADLDALRRLP